MFKVNGVLAACIILAASFFSIAQKTDQTEQTMIANIIQPTASYRGDTARTKISSHKFTVPNNRIFKGVQYALGATNGYLSVHLINDPSTTYTRMVLKAGENTGMIFNSIDSATSTVNWDSCTFFYVSNAQFDKIR